MTTTRKKKRSSSAKPRKISRSAKRKRKPVPKRKPAKKPKPKPKPRKAAKKPKPRKGAKKRTVTKKSTRSKAAQRGWATRRKKQKLLEAMVDLRMKKIEQSGTDQPLGWSERRAQLVMLDGGDGELWRQVYVSYDQSLVDAKRLETLQELEIDLLNRDDLYDYLQWVGEESDIEISDMYRMYLGYPLEGSLSAD